MIFFLLNNDHFLWLCCSFRLSWSVLSLSSSLCCGLVFKLFMIFLFFSCNVHMFRLTLQFEVISLQVLSCLWASSITSDKERLQRAFITACVFVFVPKSPLCPSSFTHFIYIWCTHNVLTVYTVFFFSFFEQNKNKMCLFRQSFLIQNLFFFFF